MPCYLRVDLVTGTDLYTVESFLATRPRLLSQYVLKPVVTTGYGNERTVSISSQFGSPERLS